MPDPTPPSTVTLTKDGTAIQVSPERAGFLVDNGWQAESDTQRDERETQERFDKRTSGIGPTIAAGTAAFVRGATLGGSDVLQTALGPSGAGKGLSELKEAHPYATTGLEIAGMLTPGSPAGYLSKIAGEGVEAARAIGGVRGALGAVAISGGEAAAQNAGLYLSDVALGDRDLSAEGMIGALGSGFAFGSLAGGATYGLEGGTMAARRMFARTMEGGEGLAGDASTAWERKSSELLDAHDEAASTATKRLEEIRALKSEVQAEKQRAGVQLQQAKLENAKVAPLEDLSQEMGQLRQTDQLIRDIAPPRAAEAPMPGGPLEQQLASMKQQLDAGASLRDLSAGPRPNMEALAKEEATLTQALDDYGVRRAKVNDWIAKFKNPRTEFDVEGSIPGETPLIRGRKTKALDEDVFVEQSSGSLKTIGKGEHTLEDITPNSRILARSNADSFSHGTVLDEAYNDAIERAKLAETHAAQDAALHEAADLEQQIHAYIRNVKPENAAVIDKINEVRATAGKSGYHAAFTRAEKQFSREAEATIGLRGKVDPAAEADYQMHLASKGPKGRVDTSWMRKAEEDGAKLRLEATNAERAKQGLAPLEALPKTPSALDEVHEASSVLGDYEKSAASLTEALGPTAPQAAQKAAADFRAAEDTATRKYTDRTARAVDAHASKSPAERMADAKTMRAEADAKLAKLKAEEQELRGKMKSAPKKSKAAEEPAKPKSLLSRVATGIEHAGAVSEMAGMAGIPGIPKPSDIPVIGPLLGAFVKFRALTGKLTGRVPATGDVRAAALAAKTKERIARSIDRSLGLVERSIPAARSAAVATTEVLGHRIFDDGQPNAPKDAGPREQCAVRVREIAAAVASPDTVIAEVRRQMKDVTDPDLIAAAEQVALRKVQYLNDNAPKVPPQSPLAPRTTLPSMADTALFARRLQVANDPVSALEATERGLITPEAAEALRKIYPTLFGQMQQRLLSRLNEIEQSVPYQQRLRLSLLYRVPLDRTVEPNTISVLQTARATTSPAAPVPGQATPPMPSVAGPVDLGKLYQSPADRRAARS